MREETFSARKGMVMYRLRTDSVQVMLVVTLLAYECPLAAIVKAFGYDERKVKNWWQWSGEHCRQVHEHLVEQVQMDEIKAKVRNQRKVTETPCQENPGAR